MLGVGAAQQMEVLCVGAYLRAEEGLADLIDECATVAVEARGRACEHAEGLDALLLECTQHAHEHGVCDRRHQHAEIEALELISKSLA
jgi:hypothetical protein